MKISNPIFSILIPRSLLVYLIVAASVVLLSGDKAHAQTEAGPIRSSAAYAEVLLRKTEIQADLEAFSADYTEANPTIVNLRFEMAALDRMLEKIFGVKPSETGKLTLALGKLIVRKAALETDHARLSRKYNKDNLEVKRAARKVEIFDEAIKEILR